MMNITHICGSYRIGKQYKQTELAQRSTKKSDFIFILKTQQLHKKKRFSFGTTLKKKMCKHQQNRNEIWEKIGKNGWKIEKQKIGYKKVQKSD